MNQLEREIYAAKERAYNKQFENERHANLIETCVDFKRMCCEHYNDQHKEDPCEGCPLRFINDKGERKCGGYWLPIYEVYKIATSENKAKEATK